MNIDKILKDAKQSYQAHGGSTTTVGGKRKREDDDDNDKPSMDGEGKQAKIMKMLEEADEIEELDAARLRMLVQNFSKAIEKNVERRMKFADEPAKFMDSEVKVHTLLQELHGVAAAPELFPDFVRLKAVEPMLTLISHENTDISIEVVDLLKELTEPDMVSEEGQNAEILLDELVKHRMIRLLVANLDRFDETQEEDKQAVHNTLGIFENLMEYAPEVAAIKLSTETKIMDWLLKRLRRGKFDENQLYSSEILSMILISTPRASKSLADLGGLKKLVRAVAAYRKRDPTSLDEVEFVENLFNGICSTLSEKKNQLAFAAADGLQLMVTMIRKKRYTQAAALKVLNYAITESKSSCEKLIDAQGLKAVFKAFMGRATEEHILHCIVQLFIHLSDIRYLRLLNKFQENGYEKIERLIELHEKYFQRLEDSEMAWKKSHPNQTEDEDERYVRRLDSGLFCLQLCAFIIALITTAGDEGIRERVIQLLNQQDSSLKVVRESLEEYAHNFSTDKRGKKMKQILENIIIILKGGENKPEGLTDIKEGSPSQSKNPEPDDDEAPPAPPPPPPPQQGKPDREEGGDELDEGDL
ncbi:hypothetical protein AAMO2058_001076400 [Amorphochlora amoebiformis]